MASIGKKFSFVSLASPLAADTFDVVSFSGTEGLSKLYRFEVILVSENDTIDLESVTQSRASLSILRDNGHIVFNGILSELEQMGTAQGRTQYRAVLTPAFWRHTLTNHNQIFLDRTVPEIIESAMKSGGLTSLDYEFRLTGKYLPHEYICQYGESLYNFISRLMEREGIYYFFEQNAEGEKVIITDTALLHSVMAEGAQMSYSPPSGLDEASREEVISTLVCRQKILPARVLLKDYNYRKPSLELTAECAVSERGLGEVYIYGEHFATPEEGTRLAQVRADELKCRAKTFHGESLIPYLRPGYLFSLAGHNRADFNTTYLTMEITHHGDQAFMLSAGLNSTLSDRERSPYYRNSFSAIRSDCQFRPERIIGKPRISGTLNAHVDAEGSGQYAEVDDQGRYKVILPFDLNASMGGKASSWLRMAQPYAGENHGMHFPLHKGTEVLLTFIDGDPDRPIIAAAVPNPITPSPVNSANCTQSHVTTAGGNKLHFEDQKGRERIVMQTPNSGSMFRVGAQKTAAPAPAGITSTDGPPTVQSLQDQIDTIDGILASTQGTFYRESTMYNTYTLGEEMNIIAGSSYNLTAGTETSITVGAEVNLLLGMTVDVSMGGHVEWSEGNWYTSTKDGELVGRNSVEIKAGGTSTALNTVVLLMIAAAVLDTALVAGMGLWDPKLEVDEKNPDDPNEPHQKEFAWINGAVYGAVLGILELVLLYEETVSFISEIALDKVQIDITSPLIEMSASTVKIETSVGADYDAAANLVISTAQDYQGASDAAQGDFADDAAYIAAQQLVTDTFAAKEAAAQAFADLNLGNIIIESYNKLALESKCTNVDIMAELGSINSTAIKISNTAEGDMVNTAAGAISNTAEGEITSEGDVNNMIAGTELSLDSGGVVAIEAAGDVSVDSLSITMTAEAEASIEASTIILDGLLITIG